MAPRETTDQSGTIITNAANPQFEGMAAARANDAEYRTAYQSCMRRRGF